MKSHDFRLLHTVSTRAEVFLACDLRRSYVIPRSNLSAVLGLSNAENWHLDMVAANADFRRKGLKRAEIRLEPSTFSVMGQGKLVALT